MAVAGGRHAVGAGRRGSLDALRRASVPAHEVVEVGAIAAGELGGGGHVAVRALKDHVEVSALERFTRFAKGRR